MRKIILPLIILSLLFGAMNFAQEAKLPSPGLTPDSPFYFLDTLGEKIGMLFTFGVEKKAEKALKYAEEKLAEAGLMVKKNKIKALEKAIANYQRYLIYTHGKIQEIKQKKEDVDRLISLAVEKNLEHRQASTQIYKKAPKTIKSEIIKVISIIDLNIKKSLPLASQEKASELERKMREIPKVLLDLKISKIYHHIQDGGIKIPFSYENLWYIEPIQLRFDVSIFWEEKIITQKRNIKTAILGTLGEKNELSAEIPFLRLKGTGWHKVKIEIKKEGEIEPLAEVQEKVFIAVYFRDVAEGVEYVYPYQWKEEWLPIGSKLGPMEWVAAYFEEEIVPEYSELLLRTEKQPLSVYQKIFESSCKDKLLQSKIEKEQYLGACQQIIQERPVKVIVQNWAKATNCKNYTYILVFMWDTREEKEMAEEMKQIRDYILESIKCID